MKLYGVISPSTETRTRIAVAQTGKKYTAETLLKISEKKRQDTPYKNLLLEISKRSLTYATLAKSNESISYALLKNLNKLVQRGV